MNRQSTTGFQTNVNETAYAIAVVEGVAAVAEKQQFTTIVYGDGIRSVIIYSWDLDGNCYT